MPLVLGVDSSTQSTKVEVRDADTGELISSGACPHPATTPPRSEQAPEDWWRAFEAALDQAGRPRVDAIAVAAQQHGLIALGADSEVLHPAKLWNDTESQADATELVEQLGGPDAWADACGSVPVPSFTVTKVAWLNRCRPEVRSQTRRIALPHDWLTLRLTGEFVTDRGDASGTGYWSPRRESYAPELLDLVGLDEDMLPTVMGPSAAVGEHDGAVVAVGTGDNMAAALGLGLQPGDVAISLGTSGTVFAGSETPTHDATGSVAGFADATGRFLPLVCTLNCMKVTDAIARLLDVGAPGLDALALEAEPGAGGVVLVPYLDGERTPNRPDATGSVLGVRSDVTRAQIARAAVEGVVCGLLDGLDALIAAGVLLDGRVVLIGGGARSSAFRRILADLLQRSVLVPDQAELAALGACLQAAAALRDSDATQVGAAWALADWRCVDPDPATDAAAIRAAYSDATG